ncbi:MAG: hypothetical protein GXY87_06765 [Tissierellia bacterium]|nr:hypothetical protein [Tissierellia bacterium]
MKKNRLTFIGLILLLAFAALALRLFDITLVNGEYYREQADNSRTKQINKKAARGNIYDANGQLLAGNVPVYNLNVYMDRFNMVSQEEKNDVLLDLVHILEEDGVSYLEDFFVDIYEYKYQYDGEYFTNKQTPREKMVDIIVDNNLVEDILNSREEVGSEKKLVYYPVNRIIDYLESKGKSVPIEVDLTDGIKLNFINNDRYKQLVASEDIRQSDSAYSFLLRYIKDDKSLFYNLLQHPLSRKVVYDIARSKDIDTGLVITDIAYVSDLRFLENKANLHRYSSKVSLTSNAKDDFLNLVKDNTLDKLISSVTIDSQNKVIVPAEILINKINSLGIESEVSYEIDQENEVIKLKYIEDNDKEESPIDYLIKVAKENNLIDSFILDPNVVSMSEQSLFDSGIYPRIYSSDWTYVYQREKADLLTRNRVDEGTSAQDLIDVYLDRYKLQGFDKYESFGIISVYNKINSKGYRAYEPVTLAYNISERTLVEIEEKMPKNLGFEVVIQPSRYYPNRTTLAHTLGYLGRISEDYEIQEYIEYRKYDGDDVVGKTGLEESFEDTLRGTNGKTVVYTDVMGNTTDTLLEVPPVPGNNLYTTINLDLQKEVESILKDAIYAKSTDTKYDSFYGKFNMRHVADIQTAAAIVTDVKTGAILASASYPSYDPNMFVNGISNTDWNSLQGVGFESVYAARPLFDMVLQGAMLPGSTFKTVVSLAALENGLDPEQKITCYGFIDIGNTRFNCLIYTNTGGTHGPINLYEALEVSCNYYYYALGLGRNPKQEGQLDVLVSLADIERTVDKLKLNKATGVEINVPHESSGYSPSLYGKQNLVKSTLRQFLTNNLSKYIKEDVKVSDDILKSRQNEIISWVDKGTDMSRNEVISELERLEFEALKPLDGEYTGLADIVKYSYLNQAIWTESDSLNMVIGQGQNSYTPIQVNQLVSTIAKEGKLVKPTYVKEIKNYDNTKSIYTNEPVEETIGIDSEHFKHVKEGMRRAALNSRAYNRLPFRVGTKTGTSSSDSINPITGKNFESNVWDMSFSPFENPEVAVTVVLVQGSVSSDASQVAADIHYAYNKYVKKDPTFDLVRGQEAVQGEQDLTQAQVDEDTNVAEEEHDHNHDHDHDHVDETLTVFGNENYTPVDFSENNGEDE